MQPSYEFHFEGLSNFSSSVEELVQIEDVNPRIYINEIQNSYQTCAWITWIHVSNTMWRNLGIKHLALLLVVTEPSARWFLWRTDCTEDFKWRLHFAIWGCVLKGLFWEGYYIYFERPKSRLKGIEGFNLEHCRLDLGRFQGLGKGGRADRLRHWLLIMYSDPKTCEVWYVELLENSDIKPQP